MQPAAERVTLPEAMPASRTSSASPARRSCACGSLRMVIEERLVTARGEEQRRHEVWLRHPGQARVTTVPRRGSRRRATTSVWLLDGGVVTTYLAARKVASRRPLQRHVVGIDSPDLPPFARQREPLTALPRAAWPTPSSIRTASSATCS